MKMVYFVPLDLTEKTGVDVVIAEGRKHTLTMVDGTKISAELELTAYQDVKTAIEKVLDANKKKREDS